MMPDMHASESCTVGTSMTINGSEAPAYIGGDIGCSMQVYCLNDRKIDFDALDEAVREKIPSGAAIHDHTHKKLKELLIDDLC